ncbi:hypothetical protein Dimus_019831 [Dionaea muscipula]
MEIHMARTLKLHVATNIHGACTACDSMRLNGYSACMRYEAKGPYGYQSHAASNVLLRREAKMDASETWVMRPIPSPCGCLFVRRIRRAFNGGHWRGAALASDEA